MGDALENYLRQNWRSERREPPPPAASTTEERRGELTGLTLTRRLMVKRTLDVALASALLVLFLPAMVLIAIAIKVDSPGPILFRQTRVGQNRRRRALCRPEGPERRRDNLGGRPFQVYKFRTMRRDTEVYARSPSRPDDPRITRVGGFLRASCLDELPQLINVLKGDMSLVGPRPEMPFIVREYNDIQRRRLDVKPGITGLWQLRGLRDRPIHETIGWDLYYVCHWSLTLDLYILLETVVFALRRRNY